VTHIRDLTAAQAAANVRAGDLGAGELFDAYREAASGDELNAYLYVANEPNADGSSPILTPTALSSPFQL